MLLLYMPLHAQVAHDDHDHDHHDVGGEYEGTPDELLLVRGDKTKGYTLLPNIVMPMRTIIADTLTTYFYRRQAVEGRALAVMQTGNLISPWQSMLYFDRPLEAEPFAYKNVLSGFIPRHSLSLFYNTRTPMTLITYHRNSSQQEREETFNGTFAANFGKKFNVGADWNYTQALGHYNSQASQLAAYRVFTNYRSDRYELFAHLGNAHVFITENGGVTDDEYIYDPQKFTNGRKQIKSTEIPVRFPNQMLWNKVSSGYAMLAHRYNFGYHKLAEVDTARINPRTGWYRGTYPEDPEIKPDSLTFVPVASVSHTVTYNRDFHRLISKTAGGWAEAYPDYVISRKDEQGNVVVMPNDTSAMTSLTNTVALSLREGFKSWVKFGLSAYLRLENRSISITDTIPGQLFYDRIREHDLYAGGSIDRTSGQGLNFMADGELAVLGANIGNFRVNGWMQTRFRLLKQDIRLTAEGHLLNVRPGYFTRHHHGTFHWWNEDFTFERKLHLSARFSWDNLGTFAEVKSGTLQNYIYYDAKGKPAQHGGVVEVLEGRVGHQFHWNFLNWELQGAYQASSNQVVLPLPKLMAYANVFSDFYIAHVLRLQPGVEAYYFSAFHAPYYEPAVMQFITQEEKTIGGKSPLMNAYVNMHIKQIRAFFKMYNIGELFFKPDRFAALHYPVPPMHFRLGISVDFNK